MVLGQMFLKVGEIQIYKHQKYCHRKDEVFFVQSVEHVAYCLKVGRLDRKLHELKSPRMKLGASGKIICRACMDCVGDFRSCMCSIGRRWHIHNGQK